MSADADTVTQSPRAADTPTQGQTGEALWAGSGESLAAHVSQSRGLSYSWRSSLGGFDSDRDSDYIAAMPVLRFIQPCLPSPADRPPTGSNWIHESSTTAIA